MLVSYSPQLARRGGANPSSGGSVNCYRLPGLSSAIERRSAFARFGATRGLEDSANLPDPAIIAQEIVEDLQAALAQFAEIASDLKK